MSTARLWRGSVLAAAVMLIGHSIHLAATSPSSSGVRPRNLVTILYPLDQLTVATRGLMPVRVQANRSVDVIVYKESPSGRIPAMGSGGETGQRLWHVPVAADYQRVCVVAQAFARSGELVGEDRSCTLPFTKPVARATPGLRVQVSARRTDGRPLGGVPRDCRAEERGRVVCGKPWSSRLHELEKIVQGDCWQTGDEITCNAAFLQREDFRSCKVGRFPCEVVGADPSKPPDALLVDILVDRSPSVLQSAEIEEEILAGLHLAVRELNRLGVVVGQRFATFGGLSTADDPNLQFYDAHFSNNPGIAEEFLKKGKRRPDSRTLLYRAVSQLLGVIAKERAADRVREALTGTTRERVLLIFTDCQATVRKEEEPRLVDEVLRLARRAGVRIYVFNPFVGGCRAPASGCRAMADVTGGRYAEGRGQLRDSIRALAEDLLARYDVFLKPAGEVPYNVPLLLALAVREGVVLACPSELERRSPLRYARRVLERHPARSDINELLEAALTVGREGTIQDADLMYHAFVRHLKYEAEVRGADRRERDEAAALSDLERLARVGESVAYVKARAQVFVSLVNPVRDALLYGDQAARKEALALLEEIAGFVGDKAWKNYAESYFAPLLEIGCREAGPWDEEQRRDAMNLLGAAGRACSLAERDWRPWPE